jgi:hypothetical protein
MPTATPRPGNSQMHSGCCSEILKFDARCLDGLSKQQVTIYYPVCYIILLMFYIIYTI